MLLVDPDMLGRELSHYFEGFIALCRLSSRVGRSPVEEPPE